MLSTFRSRGSNPVPLPCNCYPTAAAASSAHRLNLRHCPSNRRHFASFTIQSVDSPPPSEPSVSPQLFSTIGSPATVQHSQWTLTNHNVQFLSYIACAVAVSSTWLFCSAIPTLLAFKKAAQSMEKLMDTTREELPSTMAAIRLSGMEISDLTMELSDLGQGITQGVRSSTRAVRMAEEKLRRLATGNQIVTMQEVAPRKTQIDEPVLARTARGVREGIVKGRTALQMLFTLTRYSKTLLNFFTSRAKL